MRKAMLLLASAVLITVSALTVPALARDRDDRSEVTGNQLINQADAKTARMKADLRLTPAQEKDWAAFEDARHQAAKRRADRAMAMQAVDKGARDDKRARDDGRSAGSDGKTPPKTLGLLDRINADADAQIERANDRKNLAAAARPLYTSLDDEQKRRFGEFVFRRERDRDRDRDER